jgi:hypothetical protein
LISPSRRRSGGVITVLSARFAYGVGEPLLLVAQRDNRHDENAVRVLREDGKQIGCASHRCREGVGVAAVAEEGGEGAEDGGHYATASPLSWNLSTPLGISLLPESPIAPLWSEPQPLFQHRY